MPNRNAVIIAAGLLIAGVALWLICRPPAGVIVRRDDQVWLQDVKTGKETPMNLPAFAESVRKAYNPTFQDLVDDVAAGRLRVY